MLGRVSIDSFPDGFREACQKALDAVGDDAEAHAYATIWVDSQTVQRLFKPPHIEAGISVRERRDLLPPDMP